MTVEGEHEFFANGVLVHNCAAALVYLVRYVEMYQNINPVPPPHLGTGGPDWVGKPQWENPTHVSQHSEMF